VPVSTIDDLLVKIGIDDETLEQDAERASKIFDGTFAKITAAGVAAGAALETFARSQAESNTQTRQLAASLGVSEDAMRDLALETADVGFPLGEVLDLMETGKQLGITSGPALQKYAAFWDTVGDATGESATELGRAGVALASMGIEAGKETEALAAFGFIQEHSTQTVGEFLNIVGRLGPDLNAMGLDVNDTAAVLAILEQEMGMTGRAARTALNEAINESDGTFSGLLDTLGISETTLDGYLEKVEESGGIIERNADIQADEFTVLQKVQNAAEELQYRYGDLATTAGQLAPVLTALGPAFGAAKWAVMNARLIVTKGIMLAIRVATIAWTAAQWLLNVALNANPIGLIVLAVAALIAIGILLWKNWDTIVAALGAAWDWIWQKLKAFGQFLWNVWWTNGWKRVLDFIVNGGKSVLNWFTGLPGRMRTLFEKIGGFIMAPFRAAFNFVSRAWNNTIGRLRWTVPSWVPFIGGNSISAPQLPTFHDGGVMPGTGEGLALLKGGEGVFTPEQMRALGGGGGQTIVLQGDGRRATTLLLQLLAEALKGQGLQVVTR
jgi:hypothetical protein